MKITQISIFLENRKGRLYDVCALLGTNKINIRALNIAETEEFGILRIVVDRPAEAVKLLKENNFVAHLTDIVAVEVADQPGGLADILKILNENNVNVEYMYGFVERSADKALLVFRFDDPDKAIKILTEYKIKIIGSKDIGGL
ncbi:MAG: ACT domain-containing protein [bacterium]|nr:ACT domain-containing protein [bacterium]